MSLPMNLGGLDNESSEKHLNDAIEAISKLSKDITIISGENEEIHTNKHLLDLFASAIFPLFSSLGNPSQTLSLPNCSSTSIKYLINVITTFTLMDNIDSKPLPSLDKIQEETNIDLKPLPSLGKIQEETNIYCEMNKPHFLMSKKKKV